jgi:hypothetical protein
MAPWTAAMTLATAVSTEVLSIIIIIKPELIHDL